MKVGLPAADSKCWMRKVERKKIDILEFSAGNQNILYKLRPLNGNWQRTKLMISGTRHTPHFLQYHPQVSIIVFTSAYVIRPINSYIKCIS